MLQAINARTAFSERWLALRGEPTEERNTATDPNQVATASRRVSLPVLIAACFPLLLGSFWCSPSPSDFFPYLAVRKFSPVF
jgi:hypothetical protein